MILVKMSTPASTRRVDLDDVLSEAGQLGRYQLRVVAVLAITIIFYAWSTSEYVFTTARINTRCLISECETISDSLEFAPLWIANAVPSSGSTFDSCRQFSVNSSISIDVTTGTCPAALFDPNTTVPCEEYVYQNNNTIVYEFGLACDEWRRTLIGSMRSVGTMFGMLLCGLASDRWGRKVALILSVINTAIVGLLRCLSTTYAGFIATEIIEPLFGCGVYTCLFVIIVELLGPKYRMIGSCVCGTIHALGQATLALVAWGVPQWRLLTLTVYLPPLLTLAYLWTTPESMRWLMSKGRYDDTVTSLKNVARVNGKVISEKSLEALRDSAEDNKRQEVTEPDQQWLVVQVFKNKQILLRCVVAPVWWLAFLFIYYGLSVNAVNISGNSYMNYLAVSLVGIPGDWLALPLVSTIGRKATLSGGFLVCAGCQLAYLFMPEGATEASLAVYLTGKCFISLVSTTTYVYTAELFPTECRHRLFAYCSMVGRLGSILAPLTPAFGDRIPFILFGSLALVAGLLALLTPETRGAHLPDTIQEMTPKNNALRDT